MAAAYLMGEVCQRMIKPGNKNTQVTEALSKICKAYDVNMLQGILMHQMKRFVIDGNKVILTCNHEIVWMNVPLSQTRCIRWILP